MSWRRLAVLTAAALAVAGCRVERAPPPPGVLVLTAVEQQATWIRNFNPLMPSSRFPSAAGIYEPLAIFNSAKGEWVPWLAPRWEWRDGGLTLAFTLREGVQWSDGKPLVPKDVVVTFELLRRFPALDQKAAWKFLAGVEEGPGNEVRFRFQRVFVPGLAIVAQQAIVPAHLWEKLEDPVAFTNPDPVATGPFTEVRLFQNQVYELGKNPRYWQKGKPQVEAIRLPAFPSNDQANLALVDGELDWAANYVPAIDRVFVKRDPKHHHYWFPPLGGTVFLYANTTRAALGDVRVRKALSMAIDRNLVVDVAMSRYTTPSDATGMSAVYDAWRTPGAGPRTEWTRLDVAEANRLLDEAGLRRNAEGKRTLPGGAPFTPTIAVVNGWSDWVRAGQVISRGFKAVGVDAAVQLYDQGAWSQHLQEGDFDLAVAWSFQGVTPYEFYRWLMSPQTVVPIGKPAVGNWHRHGSPAAQEVFEAIERTLDPAEEKKLEQRLQDLFVEEAPAIPLFPNPLWGEFNTTRFEGFPDAANPWAALSPNKLPDCLLVLVELRPVAAKGGGQ